MLSIAQRGLTHLAIVGKELLELVRSEDVGRHPKLCFNVLCQVVKFAVRGEGEERGALGSREQLLGVAHGGVRVGGGRLWLINLGAKMILEEVARERVSINEAEGAPVNLELVADVEVVVAQSGGEQVDWSQAECARAQEKHAYR
jgi:hypothetical protein